MQTVLSYAVFMIAILLVQKATMTPLAPLDLNDLIGHTLETVSSLVGVLGGGVSSLLMGLTGISITDCAGSFKGVNTAALSCQEFLEILSTCDSLANVKPMLKAAKKKYVKSFPKKAAKPCAKS